MALVHYLYLLLRVSDTRYITCIYYSELVALGALLVIITQLVALGALLVFITQSWWHSVHYLYLLLRVSGTRCITCIYYSVSGTRCITCIYYSVSDTLLHHLYVLLRVSDTRCITCIYYSELVTLGALLVIITQS